ncbi:MAG: ArsA-related P-loop ATPase [Deltaproteobacteria bacterium]|nr:ArsA-related P-loop ATPase [Deltaproteobacteria bacterium]
MTDQLAFSIAELARSRRVLVCCGAGGVGKTTVSASLALSAARLGLRVLAITVDPSRRLAEALGVSAHQTEPVALSAERLAAVGVKPPGALSAWMLDPQLVCDQVVDSITKDPEAAARMRRNRLYQNVSTLVAGMHEYTAVEALHGFVKDNRFDLVVLDTPPSRDAIRFLDTPSRANAFLDPRIFSFFLPEKGSVFHRAGTAVINKILDLGLGKEARIELQDFLALFQVILAHLSRNQEEMQKFFASKDVAFLLVTSPAQAAVDEAVHFEARTRELGVRIGGYVLNQSLAQAAALPFPDETLLAADASSQAHNALAKLSVLAQGESHAVERDAALAGSLREHFKGQAPLWVMPRFTREQTAFDALTRLADLLTMAPAAR